MKVSPYLCLFFLLFCNSEGLSLLTKVYCGTSDDICCFSRRGKKLRLRGGADEIRRIDTDSEVGSYCHVQSILFKVAEEQKHLLDLFSNLDRAQREFYDLSRIDSWSVAGELYSKILAALTDRLDRFIQDVNHSCRKLKGQASHWIDTLQRLSHLQTLR